MKWNFFIYLIFFNIGISFSQRVSADQNLLKAIELINQNLDEEALELLNLCIHQQPENQEALFLRARVLNNQQNFLGALTDYNKVIAFDPENKEALYSRGVTRYHLQQFQAALEDFNTCLEMPSLETNTAYFKINIASNQSVGISTINRMETEIWNNIGLCHNHLSDYSAAIVAFNHGLLLEKENTDLLINRAIAYEKMGNYAFAKSDYKLVLKHHPDHELAFLNLHRLSSDENKIQELDKFIDSNPEQPLGYEDRGFAYFEAENFIAAEIDFIKAHELQPENSAYAYTLALTKIKLEKLMEAESILIDLSNQDPQNAGVFFNLGNIKYKQGHFEEAISYYSLAIAKNGKNAHYFFNRALAYNENNQLVKACDDIDRAQAIEPGTGEEFKKRYCLVDE